MGLGRACGVEAVSAGYIPVIRTLYVQCVAAWLLLRNAIGRYCLHSGRRALSSLLAFRTFAFRHCCMTSSGGAVLSGLDFHSLEHQLVFAGMRVTSRDRRKAWSGAEWSSLQCWKSRTTENATRIGSPLRNEAPELFIPYQSQHVCS